MQPYIDRLKANDSTLITLHISRKEEPYESDAEDQPDDSDVINLCPVLAANTTLTSLTFNRCKINNAVAKALAHALKTNRTITSLNLSQNGIKATGTEYLANVLTVNSTLAEFFFISNKPGAVGAAALANALKINRAITSFGLFYNRIKATGTEYLANALTINRTVTKLFFIGNDPDVVGATALATMLAINTKLTTLQLYDNFFFHWGIEALAPGIENNKSLTSLDLTRNYVGTAGITAVAQALLINTTLELLALSGNQLQDADVIPLAETLETTNTTLTTLDFGENYFSYRSDVTTKITKYLERNKKLKSLTETFSKQLYGQDISHVETSIDDNISEMEQQLQSFPNFLPAQKLLDSMVLQQKVLRAWARNSTEQMEKTLNELSNLQSTTRVAKNCLIFWGLTFARHGNLENALTLLVPHIDTDPHVAQSLAEHLLGQYDPDKPLLAASVPAPTRKEDHTYTFF